MKKSAEKCRFLLNKGGESVKPILLIIINFAHKKLNIKIKNLTKIIN
jgi:hypothetical protein